MWVVVGINGDTDWAKQGASGDFFTRPRRTIIVQVNKGFSPVGLGRVRCVKVIIFIDDHVNVPAICLSTILDF